MPVYLEPTSTIELRLGIQPNGPVHSFATQTIANHMDKYVPFREGGLAYDNRRIETDKIIFESPYAHYMYNGLVMGPNVPIKNEDGIITSWISPVKPKYYTGADLKYNSSAGHEHAGPHWDQRMVTAEIHEVEKEIQDYIGGRK